MSYFHAHTAHVGRVIFDSIFPPSNHYHVAKLLLDEGSDVNARGNAGNTSMHVAAAMGFSRLLQLFLEHPKCDVNAQVHMYTYMYVYTYEILKLSFCVTAVKIFCHMCM